MRNVVATRERSKQDINWPFMLDEQCTTNVQANSGVQIHTFMVALITTMKALNSEAKYSLMEGMLT